MCSCSWLGGAVVSSAQVNLHQYKRRRRGERVTKAIRDRWDSRVIPNRWHEIGRNGARQYLRRYGRGIGEEKLVQFAIYSENKGYLTFAELFWEKAFQQAHPGVPLHSVERRNRPEPTGSAKELPEIFHE